MIQVIKFLLALLDFLQQVVVLLLLRCVFFWVIVGMSIRLKRCFFWKDPIIWCLVWRTLFFGEASHKTDQGPNLPKLFLLCPLPCFFGRRQSHGNLYIPSAALGVTIVHGKKNTQIEVTPCRTKNGRNPVKNWRRLKNPSWSRHESLSQQNDWNYSKNKNNLDWWRGVCSSKLLGLTWRIISLTCKWLGSPTFISHLPFGSGTTPVRGLAIHSC